MLWIAVRLPYLQIDTLGDQQDQAAAIYQSNKRVLQTNCQAQAAGVAEGMSIATARALCDPIQLMPERPDAPLDALRSLQLWSYRLTPHSKIELPDSLFLEVSSTLQVFDGLSPLLQLLNTELTQRTWRHQVAIGLTLRSSALFSHCDQPPFMTPVRVPTSHQQQQAIATLPIAQLQCAPKSIIALQKIGLEHCEQINHISSADQKRVLTEQFSQYWQSLTPSADQTRPIFNPPSQFNERIEFLNTITSTQGLLFVCNRLAQSLSQYLISIQGHTSFLVWQLFDIEGATLDVSISTAQPLQQYPSIIDLTRLKLDKLTLRSPIEALVLHCDQITYEQHNQQDLFTRNDNHPPSHLLNLLAARLHDQSFYGLSTNDQHQPELAQLPTEANLAGADKVELSLPPRPTFLLHKPPPLKVQGKQLSWRSPIKLLQGPERIETGWWFIPINRDYYIGQDQEHRLLWIFFDRLNKGWYLAGVFN